jgi:hypothetical protein
MVSRMKERQLLSRGCPSSPAQTMMRTARCAVMKAAEEFITFTSMKISVHKPPTKAPILHHHHLFLLILVVSPPPLFPLVASTPLIARSLAQALERLQNLLECFCFPERFNRKLDYAIHCYSKLGLQQQPWDGHVYQLIDRYTHPVIYRTKYALSRSEKFFLLHRLTRRLYFLERGKMLVGRLVRQKFWPKVYREPTAEVVKFLRESKCIVGLGVREGDEVWPGVMDWVSSAMCDAGISPELFDFLWGMYRGGKEKGWVEKVKERGLRFGRRLLKRVSFS